MFTLRNLCKTIHYIISFHVFCCHAIFFAMYCCFMALRHSGKKLNKPSIYHTRDWRVGDGRSRRAGAVDGAEHTGVVGAQGREAADGVALVGHHGAALLVLVRRASGSDILAV